MKESINFAVRLIQAGKRVYEKKWTFFGIFSFMFLCSAVILWKFDMLPQDRQQSAAATLIAAGLNSAQNNVESKPIAVAELPLNIEISSVGISVPIVNPTTTDIASLDKELLKGAVRYPTSAKLGEVGNVVLFGHSSYLPIVKNQAYKTFNGIQKLVAGDVVTVYSSGTAYTYKVRNVAKEKADDNTAIPLSVAGNVLTLVTCNSFADKEDRFVVVADFVESHPSGS